MGSEHPGGFVNRQHYFRHATQEKSGGYCVSFFTSPPISPSPLCGEGDRRGKGYLCAEAGACPEGLARRVKLLPQQDSLRNKTPSPPFMVSEVEPLAEEGFLLLAVNGLVNGMNRMVHTNG